MECLQINLALLLCLFLIPLSSFSEIDPANIVAGWLFDEGNGGIASDISGNGHDGEIQGAPKWAC
jgi:hypothetical protein